MSTNESGEVAAAGAVGADSAKAPSAAYASMGPGRLWERFWHARELRIFSRPVPAARTESLRRARLAADAARFLLGSPELSSRNVEPLSCNLYRQSIHWSLAALASPGEGASEASSSEAGEPHSVNRWPRIDESFLLAATGGAEELARVRRVVDSFTFEHFAKLERGEGALLLDKLRAVALRLIAELEVEERAVEAIWVSRLLRVAVLGALLAVAAFALLRARDGSEKRHDLAVGKAWKASSTYSQGGCHSPEQQCADSPDYFFHTDDENEPWFEIDLAKAERVSGVHVFNRTDCCSERAFPLLVEVSRDHVKWQTVARRDSLFGDWRADFPTTEARWVRLQLKKQAPLHLMGVRVLP